MTVVRALAGPAHVQKPTCLFLVPGMPVPRLLVACSSACPFPCCGQFPPLKRRAVVTKPAGAGSGKGQERQARLRPRAHAMGLSEQGLTPGAGGRRGDLVVPSYRLSADWVG